jgi:hypothetical protein
MPREKIEIDLMRNRDVCSLPCLALPCPFLCLLLTVFYAHAFRCHLEDVQPRRLHCRLFVQVLVRSLVHLEIPCPVIAATERIVKE